MTTTKIKTIEIRVNGTEVIKQDWSNHGMIVTGQVLFRAMDKAAHDLAETLYRHRQQPASKEFDSSSNMVNMMLKDGPYGSPVGIAEKKPEKPKPSGPRMTFYGKYADLIDLDGAQVGDVVELKAIVKIKSLSKREQEGEKKTGEIEIEFQRLAFSSEMTEDVRQGTFDDDDEG